MNCKDCREKICLSSGKPCKSIEAQLRSEGVYNSEYIRPQIPRSQRNWEKEHLGTMGSKWREIPLSSLYDIDEDKERLLSSENELYL